MRASSPRYAALAPAAPLSLEEYRSQVLDDSTTLLEYLVGEKRSFCSRSRAPGSRRRSSRGGRPSSAPLPRWSARGAIPARPTTPPGLPPRCPAWCSAPSPTRSRGTRSWWSPTDRCSRCHSRRSPAARRWRTPRPLYPGQLPFGVGAGGAALRREAPRADGLALAILADPVVEGRGLEVGPTGPEFASLVRALEDAGLHRLEPLPGSRREALHIAVPSTRQGAHRAGSRRQPGDRAGARGGPGADRPFRHPRAAGCPPSGAVRHRGLGARRRRSPPERLPLAGGRLGDAAVRGAGGASRRAAPGWARTSAARGWSDSPAGS